MNKTELRTRRMTLAFPPTFVRKLDRIAIKRGCSRTDLLIEGGNSVIREARNVVTK